MKRLALAITICLVLSEQLVAVNILDGFRSNTTIESTNGGEGLIESLDSIQAVDGNANCCKVSFNELFLQKFLRFIIDEHVSLPEMIEKIGFQIMGDTILVKTTIDYSYPVKKVVDDNIVSPINSLLPGAKDVIGMISSPVTEILKQDCLFYLHLSSKGNNSVTIECSVQQSYEILKVVFDPFRNLVQETITAILNNLKLKDITFKNIQIEPEKGSFTLTSSFNTSSLTGIKMDLKNISIALGRVWLTL